MQEDRISKSLKEKISGLLTSAKCDGRLSNIDFVQNISFIVTDDLIIARDYYGNNGSLAVYQSAINAIASTYTEEEIEAFIKLNQDPLFKKLIEKMPKFYVEYNREKSKRLSSMQKH